MKKNRTILILCIMMGQLYAAEPGRETPSGRETPIACINRVNEEVPDGVEEGPVRVEMVLPVFPVMLPVNLHGLRFGDNDRLQLPVVRRRDGLSPRERWPNDHSPREEGEE